MRPIESRSKDAAALWRRSSSNGADEQDGLARVSEPNVPSDAPESSPQWVKRVVQALGYHPSRVRVADELRDGGGASTRRTAEHVRRSHD